jgi:hypothetical protein
VTTMDPRRLAEALTACASGIRRHEAGTGLLIDCGSWLHREDFASRFITTGTSISSGALLAATDWEAAVTALHAGDLPASGGERRMLLLAASIAGGIPVSLSDTLTGIDRRNASLVVSAVAHAAGLPDPSRNRQTGIERLVQKPFAIGRLHGPVGTDTVPPCPCHPMMNCETAMISSRSSATFTVISSGEARSGRTRRWTASWRPWLRGWKAQKAGTGTPARNCHPTATGHTSPGLSQRRPSTSKRHPVTDGDSSTSISRASVSLPAFLVRRSREHPPGPAAGPATALPPASGLPQSGSRRS